MALDYTPIQTRFLSELSANPWVYVLKARQVGITTVTAAHFFQKVLFTPNFKVAVIAHTKEAAAAIFEIYKRFYDYLPKHLKFKTEASNKYELKFFHGGIIRVGSASSQSFRGSTYNGIHCSEFAFWDNIELTIASIFQTATPNAAIVLETTANGLNDANELWNKETGFVKCFFSWMDEEKYVSKKNQTGRSVAEKEYIQHYELSKGQEYWFINTLRIKCASNIDTFNQEYPAAAEIAFISSGKPFFHTTYAPNKDERRGWVKFHKPEKYANYILGVDTASGSPNGDFSAATLIDVTNKDCIHLCATFYDRLSLKQYSLRLMEIIDTYRPLVVIESNSYGQAIIEELQQQGDISLYRRTTYDKIGDRWVEKIGFLTTTKTRPILLSRLHEYINRGKLLPNCFRLQNEFNSFVYNSKGKPEADQGKHDDLVMATGLALVGLDQSFAYEAETKRNEKPSSIEEMLNYESKVGKLYKHNKNSFEEPEGTTLFAGNSDSSNPSTLLG